VILLWARMASCLHLLVLCTIFSVVLSFTPNLSKENEKISEETGRTAWVRDLPVADFGAFSSSMCVDQNSGALIETLYDNPGVVRVDSAITGSYLQTELAELPYPSAVSCDGLGNAYIASSVSPSAVAAVSLTSNNQLAVKSEFTFLPDGCGGVLMMKYSPRLDVLVASCGSSPATVVRVDINKADVDAYQLTPSDRKLVKGSTGRGPWGLAVYDSSSSSFALVGLADGTLVKLSLPDLQQVEEMQTPGKRLGYFTVGNNFKTLIMFSPFPWRRIMIIPDLDKPLAPADLISSGLDQDLEFLTDIVVSPDSAMAYVVGNSQRQLPTVLQIDTTNPLEIWGIILAGVCNKETVSTGETDVSWCEWGPKGRYARSAALDVGGGRAGRMYIGVTAKYCAHCDDWHDDNDRRCKDGKEQEDYYDDKTYCLHEEWNQRQAVYGGDVGVGLIDEKSNKAWGGDNTSVVIMQLGSIPKIGGVSGAGSLAPGVFFAALAAAAALFRVRCT